MYFVVQCCLSRIIARLLINFDFNLLLDIGRSVLRYICLDLQNKPAFAEIYVCPFIRHQSTVVFQTKIVWNPYYQ